MECHGVPSERLEQIPRGPGPNSTIIAVVELIQSSWLVSGVVPGIEVVPMRSLTSAAGTTSGQLPQGRAR